jgi:hypothetical protein
MKLVASWPRNALPPIEPQVSLRCSLSLEPDKNGCPLGCCTVYSGRYWPTFQKWLLPEWSCWWWNTPKTSIIIYQTTRRNIKENCHIRMSPWKIKSHRDRSSPLFHALRSILILSANLRLGFPSGQKKNKNKIGAPANKRQRNMPLQLGFSRF